MAHSSNLKEIYKTSKIEPSGTLQICWRVQAEVAKNLAEVRHLKHNQYMFCNGRLRSLQKNRKNVTVVSRLNLPTCKESLQVQRENDSNCIQYLEKVVTP